MSEYKDIFKSTAAYYSRYREGYPGEFFSLLEERFKLTKDDRVLDLGCGTGQISLPVAALAGEVIAMDPEPEMIDEGKKQAGLLGIENITWITGGSDNLSLIPERLRNFKMVTIGTAFHWMDREKVLQELYMLLSDGGGIVIAANNTSIWSTPKEEWQKAGRALIAKYLGERRRAGSGYFEIEPRNHEDFVRASDFRDVEEWSLKWDWPRMLDEIIGYLFSTSLANPYILGDRTEAFENELRQVLADINPSGVFKNEVETQVILAWK